MVAAEEGMVHVQAKQFHSIYSQGPGGHTTCVCDWCYFIAKCSGFTICLTHSDISLSMYVSQR